MFLLHPIDKSIYFSIAHIDTAYVVAKRISACLLQMPRMRSNPIIIGYFKRALTHVKVYETPYSSTSDEEITGTCEPNSIECKNEMVSHL
ncbi:hypothetical protein T02_12709 [Trichinella nativa]|uniref:Uncharacterized protein n=1 Tax=Trichinella nativa TaxID=6335 RepID=A0A0V1KP62_9BILA|nr:hypothetical protein T02_12709 [Trichinella nativa]